MTTANRPFISNPISLHGSNDPDFYLRKGCHEVCLMVSNGIPFETDEAICLEAVNATRYFEAAYELDTKRSEPLINLILLNLYGGYTASAMRYTAKAIINSVDSTRLEIFNTFISKTSIKDEEIDSFCKRLPQFEAEIREVFGFMKRAKSELSEEKTLEAERFMWKKIIPQRIAKEKGTSLWAMA